MRGLTSARRASRHLVSLSPQTPATGPLPRWTTQTMASLTGTGSPNSTWRSFSQTTASMARRSDDLEKRHKEIEKEERIDRRYTRSDYMEKTGRDRLPRDHEITDPKIMVLDGGSTEGPLATRFVLTKLNEGESLRMIKPYEPPRKDKPVSYALCKIVDSTEAYHAEKQRKEARKKTAKPKQKDVEVSWGISEHDLLIKMRQVTGFLAKGYKVELVIGKKKGQRATPTIRDNENLVAKVRKEVEASNGFEAKSAQGEVGTNLRLFLESKNPKAQ